MRLTPAEKAVTYRRHGEIVATRLWALVALPPYDPLSWVTVQRGHLLAFVLPVALLYTPT